MSPLKIPPPKPPKMPKPEPIFKEEAVQRITELLIGLASEENQVDSDTGEPVSSTLANTLTTRQKTLEFYVTKFVEDVLAYCHRCDFPLPLIYTAVEVIIKRFKDEVSAAESDIGTNAPLSEIKMDDTSFKFAVASIDLSAIASEQLFNSLKSKLNLYRKVVSL